MQRNTPRSWAASFVIALGAAVTLLLISRPGNLMTDSAPWGSELTGHLVGVWAGRENIASFIPGSFSQAMFGGYPINQLHPTLPTFLMSLLAFAVPTTVALKSLTVLPVVLLPLAAWLAVRLTGRSAVVAALLSIAVIPFSLDTSCPACGGSLLSTVNGEYAYAWALLFAVSALGTIDRYFRTGRGMLLAVAASVATAWSHPVPSLWLAVGALLLLLLHQPWRDASRRGPVAIAFASTLLLAAVWWLPFLARREWMPVLGFGKIDQPLAALTPFPPWATVSLIVFAGIGVVGAARGNEAFVLALAAMTVLAAVAVVVLPAGGQLQDRRLLPLWSLGLWLLAAHGAGWLLERSPRLVLASLAVPAVAAVAFVAYAVSWGAFGTTRPPAAAELGTVVLAGVEVPVTSSAWAVDAVLSGYEARPDAAGYRGVRDLLTQVAQKGGCGRLAWDEGDPASAEGVPFADPLVYWQVGVWTNGCITPLSGVYIDSSATSPVVQMTQGLVSTRAQTLNPSVQMPAYNLGAGVTRMQTMGVRYYLTHGGQPAVDAKAVKVLTLVASAGPFQVWQTPTPATVASLTAVPNVVAGVSDGDWQSLGQAYFTATTFDQIPLVQDGPPQWPRVQLSVTPSPQPVERAGVSQIDLREESVSFTVAKTGSPVTVRVSAFPGWSVEGASGPYRSTPNFMVVVPTQNRVTLTHRRTLVDVSAIAAGFAGLAVLVGAAIRRRRTAELADRSQEQHVSVGRDASPSEV